MSKATEELRKKMVRKFHTLCAIAGLSQTEKASIIEGVGVQGSSDIALAELTKICEILTRQINTKSSTMDILRKRVMASIGGWLRASGRKSNAEIIKGIACRASGYDNFNKIPPERLRNLYYNFLNKQNDKQVAKKLIDSIIVNQMDLTEIEEQILN